MAVAVEGMAVAVAMIAVEGGARVRGAGAVEVTMVAGVEARVVMAAAMETVLGGVGEAGAEEKGAAAGGMEGTTGVTPTAEVIMAVWGVEGGAAEATAEAEVGARTGATLSLAAGRAAVAPELCLLAVEPVVPLYPVGMGVAGAARLVMLQWSGVVADAWEVPMCRRIMVMAVVHAQMGLPRIGTVVIAMPGQWNAKVKPRRPVEVVMPLAAWDVMGGSGVALVSARAVVLAVVVPLSCYRDT